MTNCRTCEEVIPADGGDGWDGECADCADRTMSREHCDDCGDQLEEAQIGLCDDCQDKEK